MSGFFGVCSNGAPVPGELLNRIARALEFRGPDGTQIASRDGVGFCFTFLDTKTRFQAVQPLQLGERFTLVGPDHIAYDVTIEDPKVFTRPWKMHMPIYRRKEANVQLL